MTETIKGKEWFSGVFDTHYEHVRNYLYYMSGDIDAAEDISQDVFLKLWEYRQKVDDNTIKPLLFKIARNLFLNTKKREKLDLNFVNTREKSIEHESPQYIMEVEEFDKSLQKAISSLPDQCRTFFLMNRIDDLKYQEIAANFGISVKAVEKQISKALKLLRQNFEYKM